MLRVTTLHASSAAATASYYTQYLTQAPGELPGVWTGRQAAGFGLAGSVTSDALQTLLEGRDPMTGTRLGFPLADRTLVDGRVVRAVAGFDATFSAPKSLSVLWALTQDPGLLEAHDVAVGAALDYLERFGSTTRVRADGRRLHPDSQGLTIATFRQTTSRADDPQLHTHAVVSAKVQTDDGRWLALDARFLKRQQRTLGGLYQSVLRNELAHRYGVAWMPIVNGQAEIAGMPEDLMVSFSKRTREVDAALTAKIGEFRTREGREPTRWERAALTREAAADTRIHKTGNGVADLRTRWLAEAGALGWAPAGVVAAVSAAGRERAGERVGPLTDGEVVEALSVSGSTWTRADVLRTICDLQRPVSGLSGPRWAAALERACDQVIDDCVELDPVDAAARRRRSDGRSMWLEPTAPHITSAQVLNEEEQVLSWAMDAQTDEPRPSATIERGNLDVLQSAIAAAVAGRDRLVLAVGPAGSGKTNTLSVAVADLTRHRRDVFGLAPSAKAARVLERETGMRSDTLAKLLHEWTRGDRPPLDTYRLPAGTTLIVDEGGMLGTNALARLVKLAEAQRWRIALIGDHRQLQAVGRGGLVHELCETGRCHELERIHRFTEPWEAAASLQLRRGDPHALDVYQAHDRIVPGPLQEHLTRIADIWLDTTANGGSAAITTSTNEHVNAINAAVQVARLAAGQLDPHTSVRIGGSERAHPGDVIATRRNDRRLTTSTGEPVRNRELWTVTSVHPDGSLTVSANVGRGDVTLPADYAAEYVRLGYAATEHGNQSDTVTVGVELATAGTTCRGLYVGTTRGREQNLILVITEQPDLDEARDVLERVLASDRVDVPATTQRRKLAETDRQPLRRARPPRPQARCEVPAWFDEVRSRACLELRHAEQMAAPDVERRRNLAARLTEARTDLACTERGYEPHRDAIQEARRAVDAACGRQWEARQHVQRAPLGQRRAARRAIPAADHRHAEATAHLKHTQQLAEPLAGRLRSATATVRGLEGAVRSAQQLARWSGHIDRADKQREMLLALDEWRAWASGEDVSASRLQEVVRVLESQHGRQPALGYEVLTRGVRFWARASDVDVTLRSWAQSPSRHIEQSGLGR